MHQISLERLDGFLARILAHQADDDVMWVIAEGVAELVEVDDFVLYLREGSGLVQAAATGIKGGDRHRLLDPITIPIGHAIVGSAAASGETLHLPDVRKHPGYVSDHFAGSAEISVPLMVAGEVVGVFDSEHAMVDGFEPGQVEALEMLARQLAPFIALWMYRRDERERLERQRDRQSDGLSVFAGGLAHDLNNLLAVVEMSAEILRDQVQGAERVAHRLSDVVRNAELLTGRLLTLTTSGPVSIEIVDLVEVLNDAVQMAEYHANVAIDLQLEPDLPLLRADPVHLSQIVSNVVTNAIEAIGSDLGRLTIRAGRIANPDLKVKVEFIDSGPGIPPEDIDRVFDPYFTTKANGAGLGLASAYQAVRQHGGELSISPGPGGRGTTVLLVIPGVEGRIVSSPPATELAESRGLHLLVLEDDSMVAGALVEMLNLASHTVVHISKGEDAPQAWADAVAAGQPFDLALLDLRNDIGDGGVAALRALRSNHGDVKAVAMTGYSEQTLNDTEVAGFDALVSKPFRIEELERACAAAVGARPSQGR